MASNFFYGKDRQPKVLPEMAGRPASVGRVRRCVRGFLCIYSIYCTNIFLSTISYFVYFVAYYFYLLSILLKFCPR